MNPPGGAFAPNETKIPNFTIYQKTFKNFQTMPEKSYLKKNTFKIFFLIFNFAGPHWSQKMWSFSTKSVLLQN